MKVDIVFNKDGDETHMHFLTNNKIQINDWYYDSLVSDYEDVGPLKKVGMISDSVIQSSVGTTSPNAASKKILATTNPNLIIEGSYGCTTCGDMGCTACDVDIQIPQLDNDLKQFIINNNIKTIDVNVTCKDEFCGCSFEEICTSKILKVTPILANIDIKSKLQQSVDTYIDFVKHNYNEDKEDNYTNDVFEQAVKLCTNSDIFTELNKLINEQN